MNALNRFFDRREGLSVIYYDNSTNFVGTKRYLKFMNYFGQRNTRMQYNGNYRRKEWRFIPPPSPRFRGLWESAVKSMKHLMRKVLVRGTFDT